MKYQFSRIIVMIIIILVNPIWLSSNQKEILKENKKSFQCETEDIKGAYYTGYYKNLLADILKKPEPEIAAKINTAFQQLFYGDHKNERLFYPVGDDMAYIVDINNDDVRTEGMSYGMMITVQMDKKHEFDRLWKWAKTYMQHQEGQYKNYFAWHCRTNGEIISANSASDGEEWFVTTLYFASARWGDGEGIFNYSHEAKKILDAMLSKSENRNENDEVSNMFNLEEKQIVFVPTINADYFTDPSYHLPHFYELWARWDSERSEFWKSVASTSREYWKTAANPETGLMPDYSSFNGIPIDPWNGGHDNFQYDAWRVAMNVANDYNWFAKDDWQVDQSNRLLNFFYSLGINDYGNTFTLDGKQLTNDHSVGLVAMNAAACLAATTEHRSLFLKDLWESSIPTGKYRYYDGMLYMLGLLQVSGNFRIYDLTELNK